MVRGEARVDVRELLRPWIIDRDAAPGPLDRVELGGGMLRSFLAERRRVRLANAGSEPYATEVIEHRIVRGSLGVPHLLAAPVERWQFGEIAVLRNEHPGRRIGIAREK